MLFKLFASFSLVVAVGMAIRVDPGGRSSQSISDLLNPHREHTTQEPKWTGKYFPAPPSTTPAPVQVAHGGNPMGSVNPACDDGKTNLTVDWNLSPVEYTCYNPANLIVPDFSEKAVEEIESVPKFYSAYHYCMNETIRYSNPIPTFGPHRPVWPRYGEYTYVPAQRWLHTLEHGGVVMLYHPCAHPLEVERLRRLVRSCLFRHVITPNRHLPIQRPLALVTWGKRLTMSVVDVEMVKYFILQNALQGPEKISRDGQYDQDLIKEAEIVSDTEDTVLCPVEKLEKLSMFW